MLLLRPNKSRVLILFHRLLKVVIRERRNLLNPDNRMVLNLNPQILRRF